MFRIVIKLVWVGKIVCVLLKSSPRSSIISLLKILSNLLWINVLFFSLLVNAVVNTFCTITNLASLLLMIRIYNISDIWCVWPSFTYQPYFQAQWLCMPICDVVVACSDQSIASLQNSSMVKTSILSNLSCLFHSLKASFTVLSHLRLGFLLLCFIGMWWILILHQKEALRYIVKTKFFMCDEYIFPLCKSDLICKRGTLTWNIFPFLNVTCFYK